MVFRKSLCCLSFIKSAEFLKAFKEHISFQWTSMRPRQEGKEFPVSRKKKANREKQESRLGRLLSHFLASQQSWGLCYDLLTSAHSAHLFSFSAWSGHFTTLNPSHRPGIAQESQDTVLTASGVTQHGAWSQVAIQTLKYILSAIAADVTAQGKC